MDKDLTKAFFNSLGFLVLALAAFLFVVTLPRRQLVNVSHLNLAEAPVATASPQSERRPPVKVVETEPARPRVQLPPSPPVMPAAAAKDAVDAGDDDPDVQKAMNLVDGGKPAEAVALLSEVLRRDPLNEAALVEMAMVQLLDLKHPTEAINYLQTAVGAGSHNPMVTSELVSLYQEQGQTEAGLSFLKQLDARGAGANNPELAHGIGELLVASGRQAEAVTYLERGVVSSAQPAAAYHDLAEAYSSTGDIDKSIEAFNKSIASQEHEIAERRQQGVPVQGAEERLASTKMEVAYDLIRKGELDQAQTLLEEVNKVLPNDPSVSALMGTIRNKRAG